MLGTLLFWVTCVALGASALIQSAIVRAKYRETIRTVAEAYSDDTPPCCPQGLESPDP